MNRILLTFVILACSMAHSHGSPSSMLELQMQAIAYVESNNNHLNHNRKTDAIGWLGIRKSMVREANRILGYRKFKYGDRYKKHIQKQIFKIIIQHHNPNLNLRTTCKIWNTGSKKKLPQNGYIRKVTKHYRRLASKK